MKRTFTLVDGEPLVVDSDDIEDIEEGKLTGDEESTERVAYDILTLKNGRIYEVLPRKRK